MKIENIEHTGKINYVLQKIKEKHKINESEIKFESNHSYESDAKAIFEYLKSNFLHEQIVKDLVDELEKEGYNG